ARAVARERRLSVGARTLSSCQIAPVNAQVEPRGSPVPPLRRRVGIRHRLFAAFGGVAAIAGAIAVFSLIWFHRLGDGMSGLRFAAAVPRAALVRRTMEGYASFTAAIQTVERRIRTMAILTLSITLPEARGPEAMQASISGFIEREMSWLATVQDLRSVGNELLAVVTTTAAAEEAETLAQLRQRAQLATTRMALLKRLPDSLELNALRGAGERLAATALSDDNDIFALRSAELEAAGAVAVALAVT